MRRAVSALASVTSGTLVAVLSLLFAVVGWAVVTGDGMPRAASSRFVPDDGHDEAMETTDGPVSVENQRLSASDLPAVEPAIEMDSAHVWRITAADPTTDATDRIYLGIDTDGVTLGGSADARRAVTYAPALPMIPRAAKPRGPETTTGTARVGEQEVPYTYGFELLADLPGLDTCRQTRWTLTLPDDAGGEQRGAATWCPDRGLVDGSVPLGPVLLGPAPPAAPVPVTADPPPVPAGGDTATARLEVGDEASGFRPAPVPGGGLSRRPLGVTTDGTVILPEVRGLGVLGFGPQPPGDVLRPHWIATPPGRVVDVLVLGRQVLVATSSGVLVAYDSTGRRLWEHDLPDTPFTDLRPLGADAVVVGTVMGGVTAVDRTTGERLWLRRDAPMGSSTALQVVPGPDGPVLLAYTVDRELVARDAAGEVLWRVPSSGALQSAVGTGGGVTVLNGNRTIVRYDARDGHITGTSSAAIRDEVRRLVRGAPGDGGPGDAIMAVGPDTWVSLNADTLTARGRAPGPAPMTAVVGVGVVTVTGGELRLLDPAGTERQRWPLPPDVGAPMYLGSAEDVWWFVTEDAEVISVG